MLSEPSCLEIYDGLMGGGNPPVSPNGPASGKAGKGPSLRHSGIVRCRVQGRLVCPNVKIVVRNARGEIECANNTGVKQHPLVVIGMISFGNATNPSSPLPIPVEKGLDDEAEHRRNLNWTCILATVLAISPAPTINRSCADLLSQETQNGVVQSGWKTLSAHNDSRQARRAPELWQTTRRNPASPARSC